MNILSVLLSAWIISYVIADGVCSDVIGQAASETLSLAFSGTNIIDGSSVTTSQASVQPELQWTSEMGDYYMVVMVDPDAAMAEWMHWFVANIPGDGSVDDGYVMSSYDGPSPPAGSGYHRYCTYVLKQSAYSTFIMEQTWTARDHFSVVRALETFFPNYELVADHHFLSSQS